jgi:hypothetical protein
MRAMAFLISVGTSKVAVASVAFASKEKRMSARGRFLRSRARTAPESRPLGSALTILTFRLPTAFSTPEMASAGARSDFKP